MGTSLAVAGTAQDPEISDACAPDYGPGHGGQLVALPGWADICEGWIADRGAIGDIHTLEFRLAMAGDLSERHPLSLYSFVWWARGCQQLVWFHLALGTERLARWRAEFRKKCPGDESFQVRTLNVGDAAVSGRTLGIVVASDEFTDDETISQLTAYTCWAPSAPKFELGGYLSRFHFSCDPHNFGGNPAGPWGGDAAVAQRDFEIPG